MLLLGTKNTTLQTIPAGGLLNPGTVYRRYCRKNSCGTKTFDIVGNAYSLQHQGMYKITVSATFTASAAGDVTLQLTENSTPIPGALATETITTADTEIRSVSFDYVVLVDSNCLLNTNSIIESISVINASEIEINVTNFVVNIIKVV